jgi:transposase
LLFRVSGRRQPPSAARPIFIRLRKGWNALRLKDFRRIATRYDSLARNFLLLSYLVAGIVWRAL